MKWMTIMLANGMDFFVYGPVSVRRHDLTCLRKSKFEESYRLLLLNDDIKWKVFGDSAFFNNDVFGTGGGRGMASIREPIEWSYKDLKNQWKYCDWAHCKQLRKQPIAKIIFICMLLRNAFVTMNASQSAAYFLIMPPSLEEWTSQGPRAHHTPTNQIFSNDYVNPSDSESDEAEDSSEESDEESDLD